MNDLNNTTATVQTSGVPEFNWQAFHQVDWSVLGIVGLIMLGCYVFGIVCGLVGFFGGLWILWIILVLWAKGLGALLINPLWCIFAPLIPATITYVVLVTVHSVTTAPGNIYRKITR